MDIENKWRQWAAEATAEIKEARAILKANGAGGTARLLVQERRITARQQEEIRQLQAKLAAERRCLSVAELRDKN